RGIDHLSPGERRRLLDEHPDMYRGAGDSGHLNVMDGILDIRSLQRPGLGTGDNVDTGAMTTLDDWTFDSLS
ncbi:MAG: hypothetical protein VCE12_00075, partial [Candidatus Latescibacterota bacterium]